MIPASTLVQFTDGFSRVWPRATPAVQRILNLALFGIQVLQVPQVSLPETLRATTDLRERALALGHGLHVTDADLAARLEEAAQVFAAVGLTTPPRRPQRAPSDPESGFYAPLAWSAVDLSDDQRTVTFSAGHATAPAMWAHAARMELAVALARTRALTVGAPGIGMWVSQVATLTVMVHPQSLQVRTRVSFLPRFVTQSHLAKQRRMALTRMARLRRPGEWLILLFLRPKKLVPMAEQAVLSHVTNSIEGLKSPSANNDLRRVSA